jgi:hypothetical protein
MNPSASGWLAKCLQLIVQSSILNWDEDKFYNELRATGFMYGSNQAALIPLNKRLEYTQQELAKVNLFTALVYVDNCHLRVDDVNENKDEGKEEDIFKRLVDFYEILETQNDFFKSIFKFNAKPEQKLEQLIHKRIQTNEGLIQKNFSHLITNALLFSDVVTYKTTLARFIKPTDYARDLEGLIMQTAYRALNQKAKKTNYDALVLKLLKSSLRYNLASSESQLDAEMLVFPKDLGALECLYIFDLACVTMYSDEVIEIKELEFINTLGKDLSLADAKINASVEFLSQFVSEYKKNIAYFHYSNPLNHFYQKNQKAVKLLLRRNKNRLYKEIIQSKELVYLLSQSTHRELKAEEKSKVKTQLFDIFKSIPSLAIFALPGGGVLLPIIIKFIPQLLPSAFNENYDTEE